MKLWGGRFSKAENKLMEDFNTSLPFDKRLYKEDIKGSIAHANMLGKCNIIPNKDCILIIKELENMLNEIETGLLKIDGDYEDIHSFIEMTLTERIGSAGKKLHTSRSRNDQVAVDTRMYAKSSAYCVIDNIQELICSLTATAEKNPYIMPGYTHLQRAQTVTFKHHLMAYVNMFKRDKKRIENAIEILDENPLGCCALAGTTYNIDRNLTTSLLGFKKPVDNFLDGVSDRDYLIELMSCFSIIMMHLSRLSEELIMWSSQEFKFITIDDEYSTGSSIMPQKKNPDSAELIRGKTGSVYGNLISLLTTMKGIPLAYNKDMQEDKKPFFESLDTVNSCIIIMSNVISTVKVNEDNMKNAVRHGFLNATEAADYLVTKGLPFREAHSVIGSIIIYCEENSKAIEDLSLDELKDFSLLFDNDIYEFIDYKNTLNRGIKKEMM